MKNKTIILLATLFIASACTKEKKETEQASAFRLSDTMLSKCEFYTADEKEVKNELRLFGKIHQRLADWGQ